LPPSEELSEHDKPLFRAEIERVSKQLDSAPDKATVTYQLARTYAYGKQWPDAVTWLRKAIEFKAGLDPSRDSMFTDIRGTREFKSMLEAVRESTRRVSTSRAEFAIAEGDLKPESMAYDARRKQFLLGSMTKGKVVRCSLSGACSMFASGLGEVLGVKVSGDALWLASNKDTESALLQYDLRSGMLLRRYTVSGKGHEVNDLVLTSTGEVYITDTRASAIWRLRPGGSDLEKLPQTFPFANGVAISGDNSLLYISTVPDGISVLDVKTGTVSPIVPPISLCLASIDGLYFHGGSLIAIQNGIMTPRVIRIKLSRDIRSIQSYDIREQRNPLFEGVTTGVIVGHHFYFMANIQDDKNSNFNPITILKLPL
jgi:hypothetical protein